MKSLHCDFCDELGGGEQNAFAARYKGSLETRVLYDSGRFRVFPSIGQLVEGYVLIVPSGHYATMSNLPDELLSEVSALHADVRSHLTAEYGPCLSYEHGAQSQSGAGCGIYHAHMHVVPFSGHGDPTEILKGELAFVELTDLSDLKKRAAGESYVYYEDFTERRYLFDASRVPSQYVRRILARLIGSSMWDWREYGKEERLVSAVARLSPRFAGSRPGGVRVEA